MWRAWIGLGVRVIMEYTLSLFAGLEVVYGWLLDKPTEWLMPIAGVPLYSALGFLSVDMFRRSPPM